MTNIMSHTTDTPVVEEIVPDDNQLSENIDASEEISNLSDADEHLSTPPDFEIQDDHTNDM